MRKKNLALALSVGLVAGMLATASYSDADQPERERHFVTNDYREDHHAPPQRDADPPRVPEFDPGLATSGLAILGGGLILIADRFRRRRGDK